MCGSEGTERPYTEKRGDVEWDIDANLPVYTRDYLRLVAGYEVQDGKNGTWLTGKDSIRVILREDTPKSFQWGIAEDSQDGEGYEEEYRWRQHVLEPDEFQRKLGRFVQEQLIWHGVIPNADGYMQQWPDSLIAEFRKGAEEGLVDIRAAEELGRSISKRQNALDGDSRPPAPDSEYRVEVVDGVFRRGWFFRRNKRGK